MAGAGAFGGGRGFAAANETGFDAVAVEPLEGDAVLGFEEFDFEEAAGGVGDVEVAAVGEHAVDVHQDEFDARGAREEIGGQFRLHRIKFASRRTVLEPVAGILHRYSMLPGGARVGVAVSGGADSVCLLDVLASMAAGQGWRLTVLHLNHGWRGAESDADAGFVEDLAGRYSLPCVTGKAAPPAGGNLEQQGREVRRRFFAEQRRALGLDRIATGHTLDDQAETVLFRALRGAGPGGLAGILPVTAEGIVRPLLGVKREWVLAWNRRRGLDWREDPTNADPRFRRNALRALLPELARLVNPAASEALARLAVISQDEEIDWCERVAAAGRAVWREEDGAWVARVDEIAGRGRAMARRLIRQGVENVRGGLISVDYAHIERVLALVERRGGEGKVQLPGGGGGAFVRVAADWKRSGASG